MINPTLSAVWPELANAFREASTARLTVVSPSDAIWRKRMPLRSTIHWSVESMPRLISSVLLTFLRGNADPVPIITERRIQLFPKCREGKYEARSEEHTSELQSLMRISYAVFCLKK